MKLRPLTARLLALFVLLLFGLCAGCATAAKNFAEGWRSAPSRSLAEQHAGAVSPIYGPGGVYRGYTQEVGDKVYVHRPNGLIIGMYKPPPPLEWEEYYDARGLLVKKTLSRYLSNKAADLSVTPDTTILYHYSAGGERLGTTTLMHKAGGDYTMHRDRFGRPFPPYQPLPWAAAKP